MTGERRNIFADSKFGSLPVFIPESFLNGFDLQKSDFEDQRPAYRFGRWQKNGAWYYYMLGLVLKFPTGFLMLAVVGFFAACSNGLSRKEIFRGPAASSLVSVCIIPIVLIAMVSSQTGMNTHFRYVLIALAPMCVAGGIGFELISRLRCGAIINGVFLSSAVISTAISLPYCHCYSAVSFFLPRGFESSEILGGSAADWYQGWWAAREWVLNGKDPSKEAHIFTSRWSDPRVHGISVQRRPPAAGNSYFLISIADRQNLSLADRRKLDEFDKKLLGGGVELYWLNLNHLHLQAQGSLFCITQEK